MLTNDLRDNLTPSLHTAKLMASDKVKTDIQTRDVKESERKKLAKKGDALKDGSFPIKNKQDLANAKRAIGRSKHPEAARRLIKKREKELEAGGPGSGRHPEGGFVLQHKSAEEAHSYLRNKGYTPGDSQKGKLKNSDGDEVAKYRYTNYSHSSGATARVKEFDFGGPGLNVYKTEMFASIEAGGPGSGRHPLDATKKAAIETWLKGHGFEPDLRNSTNPNSMTFWSKHVYGHTDSHGAEDTHSSGRTHHMVVVYPDGSFDHSSESSHTGKTIADLQYLHNAHMITASKEVKD